MDLLLLRYFWQKKQMANYSSAVLPQDNEYDSCPVTTCLKKLFIKPAKTDADYTFTISDRIEPARAALEALNGTDPVTELTYRYLQAMEASMPGAGFRYAVICNDNTPVLFGYFQLFQLTSQNFDLGQEKNFVKNIMRFFVDLRRIKVMISGNALRSDTPTCCFDIDTISHLEAAKIMTAVAEKIAGEERTTAIILKDLPIAAQLSKWLAGRGYHSPWEDNTMAMHIDEGWRSLNDYIAALSRKYKARANKIVEAGAVLTQRLLNEQEVADREKEIFSLFKNVGENQAFKLMQPLGDHFTQLKKVYGDDLDIMGFFAGETLVAFYSAFRTNSAYEVYYAGFDYDANNEYQLYFNILFSALGRAIALHSKQLKLGRTSFDAKASLGARPQAMNYFIRTSGIPAVVINWFAKFFSAMEDAKWKVRNPLKSANK